MAPRKAAQGRSSGIVSVRPGSSEFTSPPDALETPPDQSDNRRI
jgi:hypothetical protein